MSVPVSRWLPLAALLLVALGLRTYELDRRPMHSDEANQAVKFGQLLQSGDYAIDPRDHHGPTLYYAALPIAWLRGQRTLAAIDEITVRLVPAIAGTFAVLFLVLAAAPLGRWPALAAGAFLAVAPPAVYFSRYFIQETLLVTFALAGFVCVTRWWRTGRITWMVLAGSCIGLMFATKATAPLFVVAALLGMLAARPPRPDSTHLARDLVVGAAATIFVASVLFSSFGTHLAGLRDAVEAYGFGTRRALGASGHEKPWWYYLQLFGLERRRGLVWQQLGFSALACCGAALTLVFWLSRHAPDLGGCHIMYDNQSASDGASRLAAHSPTMPSISGGGLPCGVVRFLRGTVVYTAVIAFALSATPYKTPWHAIHFVPGMALLAAGALALLPRARMGILFALLVIVMQVQQTRLVAFQRAADERNPYAYVHSSSDVLKVRGLVDAALARHPEGVIKVIGDEYWPIPWYLRAVGRVGYWNRAPADCDGALVIASGSQIDVVRSRLRQKYRESLLGLRPDVLCVVFTPVP